ncbi:hypothetical protein RHCH11_RHCH11_04086 [Beijerinckiaceae bacterium RH CH11]|nr:TetR/AcrR family transcriptional regulator [Beijerinckiaceae bacterium]VVB50074.1 hypothetical protein RHCH11_RHCH11_04086 [Beijerinckiaceae bacterium RH CH11]
MPATTTVKTQTPATHRGYHHGDLRRTLIDAALALVTEEQNWDFSLREVARRAGVSHSAPYNHFPDKLHLLDAIAASGFEALEQRMRAAIAGHDDGKAAVRAIAQAYVAFATSNPALYRLMFGPEFARPDFCAEAAEAAGTGAKAVLREVIVRGIADRRFDVRDDPASIEMAILSCWSLVHGLAMLMIDETANQTAPLDELVKAVMRPFLRGLCRR